MNICGNPCDVGSCAGFLVWPNKRCTTPSGRESRADRAGTFWKPRPQGLLRSASLTAISRPFTLKAGLYRAEADWELTIYSGTGPPPEGTAEDPMVGPSAVSGDHFVSSVQMAV